MARNSKMYVTKQNRLVDLAPIEKLFLKLSSRYDMKEIAIGLTELETCMLTAEMQHACKFADSGKILWLIKNLKKTLQKIEHN